MVLCRSLSVRKWRRIYYCNLGGRKCWLKPESSDQPTTFEQWGVKDRRLSPLKRTSQCDIEYMVFVNCRRFSSSAVHAAAPRKEHSIPKLSYEIGTARTTYDELEIFSGGLHLITAVSYRRDVWAPLDQNRLSRLFDVGGDSIWIKEGYNLSGKSPRSLSNLYTPYAIAASNSENLHNGA